MKRWMLYLLLILIGLSIVVVVARALPNSHVTPKQSAKTAKTAVNASSVPLSNTHPPTRAELLKLTNDFRQQNGLSAIPEDPRLDTSAQEKADDETTYQYHDHVNPNTGKHGYELAKEAWPECPRTGENITGDFYPFTAEKAMDNWENSPPHRAAILSVNDIAVGFGISGKNIVEHFCLH